MELNDRLATLLSRLGETPVSFAEKLGIQRSSVSHLLTARNKPSVDFLEKLLAVYPTVNLGWLIAGLGPVFTEPVPGTPDSVTAPSAPTPVAEMPPVLPPPPGRNPVRVLLFYADGSFETFLPQR